MTHKQNIDQEEPLTNDELKAFFKWANDNRYGSNWFGWYKIDEVPSVSIAMNYGVGLTYITSEDIIKKFRESKFTWIKNR